MSKISAAVLTTTTLALIWSASASASPWPSDPRVCTAGPPLICAEATAGVAARKHVGGPGGLWQGPSFQCNRVNSSTLLRWSCPFNAHAYLVVFTAAAGHWWVKVTP